MSRLSMTRRVLVGLMLALAASIPTAQTTSPAAAEDTRELIDLAPDIRDRFLAMMREDLVNLNDVVAAVAAGDFEEAARIAERRIGLGHNRIRRLEARGASDEEIAEAIAQIRAMAEKHGTDLPHAMGRGGGMGGGMGRGGGMGGGGMGVGRHMPEELRAMGQAFHKTAYPLADAARAVGKDPSSENYRKLFDALGDMTASCLGCHETYRVK